MDWHPALEAHRQVLDRRRKGGGERMIDGWLFDRFNRYGPEATTPSVMAFDHEIEDLLMADTITLSHEMMDLALHALQSFDRTEEARPSEFMVESGFLYLPEPFTVLDRHGKKMCWRAVNFRLVPDVPMREHRDSEVRYDWGIRVILYSHILDPDEYPLPDDMQKQMIERGDWWGYAHATTVPLIYMTQKEHMSNEGDPSWNWLSFIRVVQRLMGERIVLRTQHVPPRPQRRAVQRAFDRPDPFVTVVELRRPKEKKAKEGEPKNVKWKGRWIVRGFWRNQPYPSEGVHRQKWIASYEKGPKDLDLILRDRVWVWDR